MAFGLSSDISSTRFTQSLDEAQKRDAAREQEAGARNLSLHRVPPLDETDRDRVLREQAELKRQLVTTVSSAAQPEVESKVKESISGRGTAMSRVTPGLDSGMAREQIASTARELTRDVGREHGLAANEIEAMASDVAERAMNSAQGRSPNEEFLRYTDGGDPNLSAERISRPGADKDPNVAREPDTRGGKEFRITYSPPGRVSRVAA